MGKVTKLDTAAAPGDLRVIFKAHLDDAGLSIAQAAGEIGRGESTISRWLHGTYPGDVPAVEALVARWLETQAEIAKRSLAAAGLDRYAETGVAEQIMGALAYAQAEGDIVTIIGPSGRGKTRAAERYCASRSGAFYLAVSGSVFTLPGLLSEVSEAIGATVAVRSALAAEKAVITRMRGRNYLLVVDEAHFLRDNLLDELRIIRDRARCGLALVANESIEMALNRREQIAGRVGLSLNLETQPVADVEQIAAGRIRRSSAFSPPLRAAPAACIRCAACWAAPSWWRARKAAITSCPPISSSPPMRAWRPTKAARWRRLSGARRLSHLGRRGGPCR